MLFSYTKSLVAVAVTACLLLSVVSANAQSTGNSMVTGTVVDPSGAVVVGARIEMRNPVSGFSRSVTTDTGGKFSISNVPFNPYHLSATAKGFSSYTQDVDVRSIVPV